MCWWLEARFGYAMLAVGVVVVVLGVPPWLIVRAGKDRHLVAFTFLLAVLAGVIAIAAAYFTDGSVATFSFTTACCCMVAGMSVARWQQPRRREPSLALAGLLGAAAPAAVPFALFFGVAAAIGLCLE